MQSRGLELLVGFFVCLGIAAIFILTLRVSDVSSMGRVEGYELNASFANIRDLQVGAPVNMAGVRIGRVTDIHLDQQTFEAVGVMRIEHQYDLPCGSGASILTMGLLGNQYVGVTPGGADDSMQEVDPSSWTQAAVRL